MRKRVGVGVRHHLGHRGEIDLERIDVQVGQADLAGQPLGERVEGQQPLAGGAGPSTSGRRRGSADGCRRSRRCLAASRASAASCVDELSATRSRRTSSSVSRRSGCCCGVTTRTCAAMASGDRRSARRRAPRAQTVASSRMSIGASAISAVTSVSDSDADLSKRIPFHEFRGVGTIDWSHRNRACTDSGRIGCRAPIRASRQN